MQRHVKGGDTVNIYSTPDIRTILAPTEYVGRGIIIGTSADGNSAVCAYFIMGRSENSRNRIFSEDGSRVYTEAFEPEKLKDPSLIIYNAVLEHDGRLIVTNGDQTDTVKDGLEKGLSFSEALESRAFEPDGPNFTPRISGILDLRGGYRYEMSILKSVDEEGSDCARYTFSYPSKPGLGHFIHTYVDNGEPLPTFQGEPERVMIPSGIDEFTSEVWNSLNEANRISLYVRYTSLTDGTFTRRLINKNTR
ncbi:MAG: IMP cyclohydrolase [Eubacteriaceae bacterium]|nr:IMP cyclohydrolase [Eubacteriaceae bacterium]